MLPNEKNINKHKKYDYYDISFNKIIDLVKDNIIEIPVEQGLLFKKNIKELENEYIKDPSYFKCKSNISIAVYPTPLGYTYYLVDGQHRIEMAKNIIKNIEKTKCEDGIFRVNFRFCETIDEVKCFFESLNKDSKKKLNLPKKASYIRDETKLILMEKYQKYFAKRIKDKTMPHIYNIDEFIHIIFSKYGNEINDKYENGRQFVDFIIERNRLFNIYVKNKGYRQIIIDLKNIKTKVKFYADELKIFNNENYYTIGFKNNNFIEWLFGGIKENADHINFKIPRKQISKEMREYVWKKEYDKKDIGQCPVYKCTKIIEKDDFEVGHIKSVYNGGETILENLRPICRKCNSKMSSRNWTEYEDHIFKYIEDEDDDDNNETEDVE
jgi:hypothetical protein